MQKTIDEIVQASTLPLSVIIVGVGDADFTGMEILDGDEEALFSGKLNKYVQADIVQFVPFNDFKNDPHALAKSVLEEVPGQVCNFMYKHGIVPNEQGEQNKSNVKHRLAAGVMGVSSDEHFFMSKMLEFAQ